MHHLFPFLALLIVLSFVFIVDGVKSKNESSAGKILSENILKFEKIKSENFLFIIFLFNASQKIRRPKKCFGDTNKCRKKYMCLLLNIFNSNNYSHNTIFFSGLVRQKVWPFDAGMHGWWH